MGWIFLCVRFSCQLYARTATTDQHLFHDGARILRMKQETLYYDGDCPLCRTEIDHLKKITDCGIAFQNIHELDIEPSDAEARLRVLHLETPTGAVLRGLDANVAAWQHTRWGVLVKPLRWPLIRQIADVVYDYWAARRFDRMYPGGYKRVATSNQHDRCSNNTTTETSDRMVR